MVNKVAVFNIANFILRISFRDIIPRHYIEKEKIKLTKYSDKFVHRQCNIFTLNVLKKEQRNLFIDVKSWFNQLILYRSISCYGVVLWLFGKGENAFVKLKRLIAKYTMSQKVSKGNTQKEYIGYYIVVISDLP